MNYGNVIEFQSNFKVKIQGPISNFWKLAFELNNKNKLFIFIKIIEFDKLFAQTL